MSKITLIYLFTILSIITLLVAFKQNPGTRSARGESKRESYLPVQDKNTIQLPDQEKIKEWLTTYKVPAVGVATLENGKVKQVKVIGQLEENKAAPDNTIFNVASLTKPVVAILTLKLVEAGKLTLDEPLSSYWLDPDIKDNPFHTLLTARIILSHQTGFPNWRGDKKLSFQFRPGSKYQYSGEGFEYLRKAIEQKLGKTLEELSQAYIFAPL
jgi:CubicO group peptidase (beta-lactamase class C family)